MVLIINTVLTLAIIVSLSLMMRIDGLIRYIINSDFTTADRILFSLPPRLGWLDIYSIRTFGHLPWKFQENDKRTGWWNNKPKCRIRRGWRRKQDATKRLKQKLRTNRKRERKPKQLWWGRAHTGETENPRFKTEKGASSWLNTMPLEEHDFYLSKQIFWDTIHLIYGIPIARLPAKCVCDATYSDSTRWTVT